MSRHKLNILTSNDSFLILESSPYKQELNKSYKTTPILRLMKWLTISHRETDDNEPSDLAYNKINASYPIVSQAWSALCYNLSGTLYRPDDYYSSRRNNLKPVLLYHQQPRRLSSTEEWKNPFIQAGYSSCNRQGGSSCNIDHRNHRRYLNIINRFYAINCYRRHEILFSVLEKYQKATYFTVNQNYRKMCIIS